MAVIRGAFKNTLGFNITSYGDVLIFLDDMMLWGELIIPVNENYEIRIEKHKDGSYEVYERQGDLTDPFNPEVQVPDEIITLYKYRKYFNQVIKFR